MNTNGALMKGALVASGLVVTAIIAGCGKASPDSSTTAIPTTEKADPSLPTIPRDKTSTRNYQFIDLSWQSLPMDEFRKVDQQVRSLYWSGAQKDYEKLAFDFSSQYQREKDSFKKAELLKQITPQLDSDFDHAQKQKDFSVLTKMSSVSIQPYDAKIGGFTVTVSDAERSLVGMPKDPERQATNESWMIRFIGLPADKSIVLKRDEQAARRIEAALSTLRRRTGETVLANGQFQGAIVGTLRDDGQVADVALFRVDSVTAADPSGKAILTIAPRRTRACRNPLPVDTQRTQAQRADARHECIQRRIHEFRAQLLNAVDSHPPTSWKHAGLACDDSRPPQSLTGIKDVHDFSPPFRHNPTR